MKLSHSWLQEYIDVRLKPATLAERLSMLGLEVESFEEQSKLYEGFIVGEIVDVRKHPNADRLTVCKVNIGKELLDIVCGASNVEIHQKVVVGIAGATVPHNQHDPDGKPFVLSQTKIRGVVSNGMICSAYELGLGDDKDGIMVLQPEAKVGTPFARYVGRNDTVYEVEITANRGDWLSHIGVAREIGVVVGKKVRLPAINLRETKKQTARAAHIRIQDRKKCLRYVGRIVEHVTVDRSPEWLQNRLRSVGFRPINNIVDVTNYVMLETGQPLHAFDYNLLHQQSIVVRAAHAGEKLTTLDGKERSLDDETLLICDGEGPIAIAGVMGGVSTEINNSTTSVFIESAYFHPSSIRRTSKYLNLSTDASQRFERGVDIGMTRYAADRAAQLMQDIAGGEVLQGALDVYPRKVAQKSISIRVDRTNAILSTSFTGKTIRSLLERVGLTLLSQSRNVLRFSIPTYRNDLVEEIDLIEEVARVYGYDKIETSTFARVELTTAQQHADMSNELRRYFVGAGFLEIMTVSMHNREQAALSEEPYIEVLNPVSADAECLRTNLIVGGLQTVQHNRSHGYKDLRLFEVGNVFLRKHSRPPETLEDIHEEQRLLLLLTGSAFPIVYGAEPRKIDLFDLKGEVEALLTKFVLDKYCFISYDSRSPLIETGVAVEINGTYAGFLGKIKRSVLEKFEIEDDVFVCELIVAALQKNYQSQKKFRPIPRYPKVIRDLAFVVEETLPQLKVEEAIKEAGGQFFESVRLFDVYAGDQIGQGKKSLAYSVEFQPTERTLTDKEIDEMVQRIVQHLQKKFGARLRDV